MCSSYSKCEIFLQIIGPRLKVLQGRFGMGLNQNLLGNLHFSLENLVLDWQGKALHLKICKIYLEKFFLARRFYFQSPFSEGAPAKQDLEEDFWCSVGMCVNLSLSTSWMLTVRNKKSQ